LRAPPYGPAEPRDRIVVAEIGAEWASRKGAGESGGEVRRSGPC
jgi:hypothetical protein